MPTWLDRFLAPPPAPDPADPLSHPQIARMSPQELADLPLTPHVAPCRAEQTQPRPLTCLQFRASRGHVPG